MIEHIGRYRIIEEIGQGATAIVYKAHDPKIDRTLAIKVLRKEKCIDAEYRRRFLRESKAAGKLSHPNIVTIYDVGEYDDQPYIAMELLPGSPLDEIMKSSKIFSRDEIINISIQLATALDYAHKNGIVHRDIKPSNIVCSFSDNGSAQLKITDFGIAHIEDTSVTQQTQAGDVLGTPLYMSPEQVLGQKIDGRSDLFSVGVILYQLYTGRKPFTGSTVATLLFQIATEDPVPINRIIDNFPASLRKIIDKLLMKQPDKRFKTGHELVIALKEAADEIAGNKHRKKPPRLMPLRVKWTIIMASVIVLTMTISLLVIYNKQQRIMANQLLEFGVSLAKFIAADAAEPILSEDWISIELDVQEISEGQNFVFLGIIDHQGIIRGHSQKENIGKTQQFPNQTPVMTVSDTNIYREKVSNGEIFSFTTPILFQNKNIGRVYLGLSREALTEVNTMTLYMMLGILFTISAIVILITYLLAKTLSTPVKTLREAMDEINNGNFDYRIAKKRRDEFGQLYSSYNAMAESLQNQEETIIKKD